MNKHIALLAAFASVAMTSGCATTPSDNQQVAENKECKVVYYSSASQTISASAREGQVGYVTPLQGDDPTAQAVGDQQLGLAQVQNPRNRVGGLHPNSNIASTKSGC
jgi:hypothetical protein